MRKATDENDEVYVSFYTPCQFNIRKTFLGYEDSKQEKIDEKGICRSVTKVDA